MKEGGTSEEEVRSQSAWGAHDKLYRLLGSLRGQSMGFGTRRV